MKEIQQMYKEAVVQKFFSLFHKRQLDDLSPLFAPHAQIVFIPWGDGGIGEVNILGKVVWEYMIKSFPDITHTVRKAKTDAYGYLICEVMVQGTQQRDFWAIRNRGHSFTIDQIFLFHFNDQSLIDKVSVNWDHYEWRRQLGDM